MFERVPRVDIGKVTLTVCVRGGPRWYSRPSTAGTGRSTPRRTWAGKCTWHTCWESGHSSTGG